MFLSQRDAQRIADEVKHSIQRDVNIMDQDGVILASTDPSRVHQVHAGARKILSENLEELVIAEHDQMEGAQMGINLPIRLHDETVGVIGITGPPEEVGVFGSVIKMMAELMIERVWKANEENQLENARALFLENWLFSNSLELAELEMRGRLLGIDVSLPRFLILLEIRPDPSLLLDEKAAQEVQSIRLLHQIRAHIGKNPQNFCTSVHQRILLLLCGERKEEIGCKLETIRRELESFYPMRVCGGVSTVTKECMELHLRYMEAKVALRVSLHSPNGGVSFYDAVSLNSVLQTIPSEVKHNVVKMVFASCTAEEVDMMMETIHLYFKHNGDMQKAADEVFIHKNTFQYRVQKVGKRTGYWLKHPRDVVMLYMVMQFYDEGFLPTSSS